MYRVVPFLFSICVMCASKESVRDIMLGAQEIGVLNTGQYASAFHYFSSSINLVRATGAPDFASAYMYLGVTLVRLNDFENACQAYEKALEIDRDDHLCHLNYAVSLLNAGQEKSAEKHLEHFERIFADLDEDEKNNDPDVLEVRAELLNRLKN